MVDIQPQSKCVRKLAIIDLYTLITEQPRLRGVMTWIRPGLMSVPDKNVHAAVSRHSVAHLTNPQTRPNTFCLNYGGKTARTDFWPTVCLSYYMILNYILYYIVRSADCKGRKLTGQSAVAPPRWC